MKQFVKYILVALFLVYPGVTAAAQWTVDPTHSSVTFRIQHIYSTVSGHFSDFEGDIVFSPESLGESRLDFTVTVDSINTFVGKRDRHLRSDDFFHADKYPVMTFTSEKIVQKKDNIYTVTGTMTVKDVSEKFATDFVYHAPRVNPLAKDKLVAGFETAFPIDRLTYGVGNGKFYKMGIVGKTVDVFISLEVLKDR